MADYEADKYFKEPPKKYGPPQKRQIDIEDVKEIKIRFRPRVITRMLLVGLVIFLLGYVVIDLIFYHPCKCGSDSQVIADADSQPTAMAVVNGDNGENSAKEQNQPAETPAAAENSSVINETAEQASPLANASPQQNQTQAQNQTANNTAGTLSSVPKATISFSSSDVETDGAKVIKISFKLKNEADSILRARVDAGWYDEDDESVMKDKVNGFASFVVPSGNSVNGEITDFTRKYTNPTNGKETVFLKAYDSINEKLLDTQIIAITP